MPNSLNSNPIIIDTTLASFGAGQTLQHKPFGIRPYRLSLVAVGTTTAGLVTITAPSDGAVLYPSQPVLAGVAAGQVIFSDEIFGCLMWRDFSVNLGATNTKLYIHYRS